jgi:hypothetical protein
VLAISIVEGLALVLLGMLVVGLLRSHAEILRALDELGAGRDLRPVEQSNAESSERSHEPRGESPETRGSARDLEGVLPDGSAALVGVAEATHDTLLAFLSVNCATCQPFWTTFADPSLEVVNGARLVVVVQGHEDPVELARLGGADLLVVQSDAAWSDYDVPGSPHFVYVDGPSGRVTGEGTGATWKQVRSLLSQADGHRRRNRDRAVAAQYDVTEGNADRVDRELLAAGIGPGHASLYAE